MRYLEREPTEILDADPNLEPQLRSALEKRSFTPFVGAGASSMRPSVVTTERDLPKLGPYRQQLVAVFGDVYARLAEPEERSYLLSVAEGHGRIAPELAASLFARGDFVVGPWDLREFQVDLVRFATAYTRAFAAALAQSPRCVDGSAGFRLVPSAPQSHLDELLVRVRAHLAGIPDGWPRAHPWRARGQLRPRYYADKVRSRLGKMPAPSGELRLDVMEWLSDLVWYGFSYWVPQYPTTSQLAFALSLVCGEMSTLRRPELAQAAEYTVGDAATHHVQAHFEYCEKHMEEVPPLHRAIARALKFQYHQAESLRQAQLEVDGPDAEAGSRMAPGAPSAVTWPVVFTTNFDNLLEAALTDAGLGYDLVFPVEWTPPGGIGQGPDGTPVQSCVKWLYYRRPADNAPAYIQGPKSSFEEVICGSEPPPGPLVVKLHGMPLKSEMKPGAAALRAMGLSGGSVSPCLVLAESDYLYFVFSQAVPGWLKTLLRTKAGDESNLWFLGYSVSDWNIRLKLFEHLHAAGETRPRGRQRVRMAYSRPLDEFHRAILGTLQVKLMRGELDFVATTLDRVAGEYLGDDGGRP